MTTVTPAQRIQEEHEKLEQILDSEQNSAIGIDTEEQLASEEIAEAETNTDDAGQVTDPEEAEDVDNLEDDEDAPSDEFESNDGLPEAAVGQPEVTEAKPEKVSKALQQANEALALLEKGPVTMEQLKEINPVYPSDPIHYVRKVLKKVVNTHKAGKGKTTYSLA